MRNTIRVTFLTAHQFLAEQRAAGEKLSRLGTVIRVSAAAPGNMLEKLSSAFHSAWDQLDDAVARHTDKMAVASQDEFRMFHADSLRIGAEEQITMLLRSGHVNRSVADSAAHLRNIHQDVQRVLVENFFSQPVAMMTLARNCSCRPEELARLARHHDKDVRRMAAANLSGRMPIDDSNDPVLDAEKQSAFKTMIDECQDSGMMEYLVPPCRNPEALADLFEKANHKLSISPKEAKSFVDNPFTPDAVLLEIASSAVLRIIPGGHDVAEDAVSLYGNRRDAAKSAWNMAEQDAAMNNAQHGVIAA